MREPNDFSGCGRGVLGSLALRKLSFVRKPCKVSPGAEIDSALPSLQYIVPLS